MNMAPCRGPVPCVRGLDGWPACVRRRGYGRRNETGPDVPGKRPGPSRPSPSAFPMGLTGTPNAQTPRAAEKAESTDYLFMRDSAQGQSGRWHLLRQAAVPASSRRPAREPSTLLLNHDALPSVDRVCSSFHMKYTTRFGVGQRRMPHRDICKCETPLRGLGGQSMSRITWAMCRFCREP